ncbi:hypothetical protein [Thermus aquaticus]|uniref:hypothetical protein n=1 Tax=Thermus aquaticus TaxID=271 RepID=UPI0012E23BAB|nr:hypothetical protein [Thermus aquaticus]
MEERTRWALELQEGLFLPPAQARAREAVLKVRDILGFSGLWPDPKVLSRLILRHLVAVDLDTRALDVARVNLWKEAIKLAPKAFRYTNLGQVGHALPDLRLNLIHGDTLLSPPRGEVLKALAPRSADLKRLWSLREAYLRNPLDHAPLEEALALKDQLRKDLNKDLNLGDGTFLELEFFWLFFDPEGEPLPNPGAHVEPPWENVKPFKKEYAARFPQFFGEDFSKFALDDKEFERRFQEALKDQGFREGWEAYQESRRMYAGFLKERYPLMGQGDPSLALRTGASAGSRMSILSSSLIFWPSGWTSRPKAPFPPASTSGRRKSGIGTFPIPWTPWSASLPGPRGWWSSAIMATSP